MTSYIDISRLYTMAAANKSTGFKNWTSLGAEQYCDVVNGTLTQTYRFRPFINRNGADVFTFGLRAGAFSVTEDHSQRHVLSSTRCIFADATCEHSPQTVLRSSRKVDVCSPQKVLTLS